jgi:murein L,D-transpeptidase YafK
VREEARSEVARIVPSLREHLWPRQDAIAIRLRQKGFQLGQPALIRIFKQEAQLEVWLKNGATYALFETFPICRFSGTLGPKLKEGDRQAPEGYYLASERQLLPTSKHHRAINTGFPNSFDRSLGRTGTVLMIHGDCSSIGCYAMTDPMIDDIYNIVEAALHDGQSAVPMHLYPFRMTEANLHKHGRNRWSGFWQNLAEGDRLFQQSKLPPKVYSCGGRYVFGARAPNCEPVVAW